MKVGNKWRVLEGNRRPAGPSCKIRLAKGTGVAVPVLRK